MSQFCCSFETSTVITDLKIYGRFPSGNSIGSSSSEKTPSVCLSVACACGQLSLGDTVVLLCVAPLLALQGRDFMEGMKLPASSGTF